MQITKRTGTNNTTKSTGRKILYIAIHFTAGTTSRAGSAANTADWFKNPLAGGSADYIVDDASIVQYNPDPANRYCWAVGGSKYNDKGGSLYGIVTNRNSISVEICSSSRTGKVVAANNPAWYFTEAVVSQAVELTKYLMRLYGISLNNVIRHYDITGKLCPGIVGWNADSGNEAAWKAFKARLTAATVSSTPSPASTNQTITTPVTDTEKAVWNFLKERGLNDCAAAGIMGNLYAESNLKANNLQGSFEKSLNMTDESYTAAVDSGEYDNFVRDGAGYGLCQWTYWTRKDRLLAFARETGRSIGDLAMQLEFFWNELQSDYSAALKALNNAASVLEASNIILKEYERPADQGEAVQQKRASFGQGYFDKLAFVPFLVRVSIPDLNIRTGPGTNYPRTGAFCPPNVYTIVEQATGKGASVWYKLKSGAGWISGNFTVKV